MSLAVGLDRAVGVDDRHGPGTSTVWTRSVSGSGFGPETVLSSSGTTVLVSGGRTAVVSGSTTTMYDRGVAAGSIPDATAQVTGPYLRAAGGIWNSDGTKLSNVTTAATSTHLYGHCLIDLQLGSTGEIGVTQSDIDGSAYYGSYYVSTNGFNCTLGDGWENQVELLCPKNEVLVTELVAALAPHGPDKTLADGTSPVSHGLGDGYLLLKNASTSSYSIWTFAANTITSLPDCTSDPVTDGEGHVACTSASDIVWRDYSALSTSAPRMLGSGGPAWIDTAATPTWSPAIDTDKALLAGTLDIMTSVGQVIRTLPTPATDDGSLRGVTWDGRDSTGALVSPGGYLFRLNASAKDGSGAVTQLANSEKPELLSRAPDSAGLQHWATLTTDPTFGRDKVAYGFYQSTESRIRRVTNLYQALLHREPDPTGWPFWADIVYNTGDLTLAVNLAGSQEYWLRAQARF